MSQIKHAVRCLSVALVLVAAFVTLSAAHQTAAEEAQSFSRAELEKMCKDDGGSFVVIEYAGGDVNYSCVYPEGDKDECTHLAGDSDPFCEYFPAPSYGTLETSQPADGEYVDQFTPAQSSPADSHHGGYEYKMAMDDR